MGTRSGLGSVVAAVALTTPSVAQTSPWLSRDAIRRIGEEVSGERALSHFLQIVTHYGGFTPSLGGDQIADYLAGRARAHGLSEVSVEGFPADGRRYVWTFLTEPSWDAEAGTLTMVAPRRALLADFATMPVSLGRFSRTASFTAELVDVGSGLAPADYRGKEVRGKLVLVSGEPGAAHARAVWREGALGVLSFRERDAREPLPLVSNPTILPWTGPTGGTGTV